MNTVIGIVGISIAAFFGVLTWTLYRPQIKRTATELMRDFRAMLGGDLSTFPVLIVLKSTEIAALKSCHVNLPRRPRERDSEDFSITASIPELLDLHRIVMGLAQERIGRAARRQQVCLSGTSLALGALAGHLHSLVLAHCSELPPTSVHVPLQGGSGLVSPRPMPDNPG